MPKVTYVTGPRLVAEEEVSKDLFDYIQRLRKVQTRAIALALEVDTLNPKCLTIGEGRMEQLHHEAKEVFAVLT